VFFPECTRSNGKGVLDIPTEALEFIQTALWSDGFKVHVLRFDYTLTTSTIQPYNSTDVLGLKHALIMLSQFLNQMRVQYLFNLESPLHCGSKKSMTLDELKNKIRGSFMTRGHEYLLDKDWRDH